MEKYGTMPKRFTKEWWDWFWEYHKIHVLVIGFILFILGVTVYQAVTKTNYDTVVSYMGMYSANETQYENIEKSLEEVVPDVNENGKTDVLFQVFAAGLGNTGNMQDGEYKMAIETKKTFELQMGDTFVFIADETQMNTWYAYELIQDMFLPADDWLSEENKSCERAEGEGENYFVKLPAENLLAENKFAQNEELYIAVRVIRENEDKEKAEAGQYAGKYAANRILSKR